MSASPSYDQLFPDLPYRSRESLGFAVRIKSQRKAPTGTEAGQPILFDSLPLMEAIRQGSRSSAEALVFSGHADSIDLGYTIGETAALVGDVVHAQGFVPDNIVQFDSIVPKRKQYLLDRHFMSWAMRFPRLRKLSYELDDLCKTRLGDVVLMSEQEILDQTAATPKMVTVLKTELATIGLKLGMRAPGWNPVPRRPTAEIW